MSRLVLIVDKEPSRRHELAAALRAQGAEILEAEDPFSAMAALGQQAFDALCAHAGPRHLSLRGLFQLAKRKRDDIAIWVYVEPADLSAVEMSFSGEALIVDISTGPAAFATRVLATDVPPAATPAAVDIDAGATAAAGGVDEAALPVAQAIMDDDLPLGSPLDDLEVTEDLPMTVPFDVDVTEDLASGDPVDAVASEPEAPAPRAPDAVPLDLDAAAGAPSAGHVAPDDDDADAGFSPLPDTGPPAAADGFDVSFETPPPAGAWELGSGDESADDDDALLSTSGEGAPPGGAETLIDAFAREVTGRMIVEDGDKAWRLYLYGGEPAWVEPPGGDAVVFERLVATGNLPPDALPDPVPEGTLLTSLVERGSLSADDAKAFMRQLVFDTTLDVASLASCSVDIDDAPQFLSTPPPFRVNPFGLVLESRRRRTRPEELLAQARDLTGARVTSRRALDKVYGKVAPFLRGVDVRALLSSGATVAGFRDAAGVDDLLATQLVLALEAGGLVRVDRAPVIA